MVNREAREFEEFLTKEKGGTGKYGGGSDGVCAVIALELLKLNIHAEVLKCVVVTYDPAHTTLPARTSLTVQPGSGLYKWNGDHSIYSKKEKEREKE